jgi:hypothetical protein
VRLDLSTDFGTVTFSFSDDDDDGGGGGGMTSASVSEVEEIASRLQRCTTPQCGVRW